MGRMRNPYWGGRLYFGDRSTSALSYLESAKGVSNWVSINDKSSAFSQAELFCYLEVPGGFEPPYTVLQTAD